MAERPRPRILITRPEPGASFTAEALYQRGLGPMKVPLTKVGAVPVADSAMDSLVEASLIVISSANAMRHAPPGLVETIAEIPALAVGDATAAEAVRKGMTRVESVDGDADALVKQSLVRCSKGALVGYLCGRLRRDTVEVGLAKGGLTVNTLETYNTHKVSYSTDKLSRIFTAFPFDGVAVFSGVSAAIVAEQIATSDLRHHYENKPLFVISQRASEHVATLQSGPILVSKAMNAESLHTLIESYFFSSQP
ncbi:MAG: uroporphyrinogen-III synthase [Pseudomonadota bacterium]